MGAINCRESKSKSDSCANPTVCGTTGIYQQKQQQQEIHKMSDEEYLEPITVCQFDDLQENEMKQLDLTEDVKILLIKQNGQLTALGNKCTHYGAPLHTGALGLGRLRCPWHGACFDIHTGDIEDFPGLDSLPCYKVQVENDGQVKVSAKRADLEKSKRLKNMVARSDDDNRCFIIVGGGPAAGVCAETLRQEGYTGRLVMVCREMALPYDRVKISKAMNLELETLQFRSKEFYEQHSIEIMSGVEATKLHAEQKIVILSDGQSIQFDKIFIATGSRAVKPPIQGANLQNVFTIRDHADAKQIHQLVTDKTRVVCLGSSFIALEAASALAKLAASVTLIGREDVPLKASFGKEIGARVLKLFEENNVCMLMNSGIEEIKGNVDGKVEEVVLKDGVTKLPCDLLIMGTGTRCYTDFLQGSGLLINPNGSIDTDVHLRTNCLDIYAGGDIANAPLFSIGNDRATIGHYQLAQYHGRIAGKNMAGAPQELRAVPFFFTMLFGKGFRYSGYGDYADIYIDGDLENLKFAAYFLNEDNRVIAVASCARDPIASQFQELQSQGKTLRLSDVKDAKDKTEWTKLLLSGTC